MKKHDLERLRDALAFTGWSSPTVPSHSAEHCDTVTDLPIMQARPHLATLDRAIAELASRANTMAVEDLLHSLTPQTASSALTDVKAFMPSLQPGEQVNLSTTGEHSTESYSEPSLHFGVALAGPSTPEGPMDWLETFLASNPFEQTEEWEQDGADVFANVWSQLNDAEGGHVQFDPAVYDLP